MGQRHQQPRFILNKSGIPLSNEGWIRLWSFYASDYSALKTGSVFDVENTTKEFAIVQTHWPLQTLSKGHVKNCRRRGHGLTFPSFTPSFVIRHLAWTMSRAICIVSRDTSRSCSTIIPARNCLTSTKIVVLVA